MRTFWGPDFAALERADPELAAVVLGELARQRSGLQLIASENFASPAVLAALGSTLTDKYAEGYPVREGEMGVIARLVAAAARCDPESRRGAACLADLADEVSALVRRFPAYARERVPA